MKLEDLTEDERTVLKKRLNEPHWITYKQEREALDHLIELGLMKTVAFELYLATPAGRALFNKSRFVRAFRLYAELRERMEDVQIMAAYTSGDWLRSLYYEEYRSKKWKAEVLEQYIERLDV